MLHLSWEEVKLSRNCNGRTQTITGIRLIGLGRQRSVWVIKRDRTSAQCQGSAAQLTVFTKTYMGKRRTWLFNSLVAWLSSKQMQFTVLIKQSARHRTWGEDRRTPQMKITADYLPGVLQATGGHGAFSFSLGSWADLLSPAGGEFCFGMTW